MKRIFLHLFISVFAIAGVFILIRVAKFAGKEIDWLTEMIIYTVWLVSCFTAYRWLPKLFLSTMRVRKTILEEEEWIHPLMHELNLRTGIEPLPEIFILEEAEIDAFALGQNMIVLSRGLLVNLKEQEIKAVLAHEYGHLKSRDTIDPVAFTMASKPGLLLFRIARILFGIPSSFNKRKWSMYLILLLLAAGIFVYPGVVLFMLFLFIFMKLFPFIQQFLTVVYCIFCRDQEFRQDAFAHSLGCGVHLKSALLKIDALNSESLVARVSQFGLKHPMTYKRIRRIEWMEGLRNSP